MWGHGLGNSHLSEINFMKIIDNLTRLFYQPMVDGVEGRVFQYPINDIWRGVMTTGENVQHPRELMGQFYTQRNTGIYKDFHAIAALLIAENKPDLPAELPASLYGEAFDEACARWERDLSPDGVARHVERLKEDGLYDATKPDASQVLERGIPASQFAHKWTPKRIHYIGFKRTVTKNLGILLHHSLGKLPRGQLKVHNRSSLDVTAKQAYNAVKRWTKNLTECKIYSNLDELAREKHLLGKNAKVICINEVLIPVMTHLLDPRR